jgi:hypothetical protein
MCRAIPPLLQYVFTAWWLVKHRDNFTFTFYESIGHLVGLLERGIGPTQGLYLHRTTQTQRNADTHPCLEWDSNPRFQCSSGQRQYVTQTARPLGSALMFYEVTKFIEQSPSWEANSHSASQVLRFLWNQMVRYHVQIISWDPDASSLQIYTQFTQDLF